MKELLAAVYERPDDDGPRAVLADWLQERGDPRGEFITLQLERARSGAARASARESQLVTVHGKSWAGPLDRYLKAKPRLFRRGFLAAAELPLKGAPPDDPSWATLEALDLSANHVPRQLRAVRELRAVDDEAVVQLVELDVRPRTLDVVFFYQETIAEWKRLCASPAGSAIESVSFRGYAKVAQYLDAARPPRLRELWCWPDARGVLEYVAAHPELTALEVDDKGRPTAPRGSGTPAPRRRPR